MDDWKLKARVVVKLRRDANMLVSCYRVSCFISLFYFIYHVLFIFRDDRTEL